MYSPMQSLSSFALSLGVILTSAFIASGSLRPIANGPKTKSLVSRQAPGVVAPSDFLRRGGHASVVAGDWVYIDGGEFSFLRDGQPNYQYLTTILSIDLSQTWSNSTVLIHSTSKPNGAPNLVHPSLWYDEQQDLLYSGFAGSVSEFGDGLSPPPLSLWTFKPDGFGSGSWNVEIDSSNPLWDNYTRPGQPMMASGSGKAFALGGYENSRTSLAANNSQNDTAVPGLVEFNLTAKATRNSTASGYSFNGTAEKGAMHYVPSFGTDGLFVVMGGDDVWNPDYSGLKDLQTISILDSSSLQWFNQTTTGHIPLPRKEFCLAGIESNNRTYEIYVHFLYAGWNGRFGATAINFDEIYILTLPAFHWLKVDYPPQHPRHDLTCNAVGGSQILTIGGVDTNPKDTTDGSTHKSTFDSSADPFAQGLAIFDMTALKFANQYTAKASPYVQSDLVRDYYETRPAGNLDSTELAKLFDITHFSNTTTSSTTNSSSSPTNSPSSATNSPSSATDSPSLPDSTNNTVSSNASKGTPAGTIAGGIVGGVAVLALLGALIFFAQKRRRSPESKPPSYEVSGESQRQQQPGPQEMYQMPEEMGGNPVAELGANSPIELWGGHHDAVELNGSARR
ncbi:hypothetical protein MMC07_006952 [Pseudocyphellaria aurata]|nr:hypothetical protein [Pseudocyphellaria aurata]